MEYPPSARRVHLQRYQHNYQNIHFGEVFTVANTYNHDSAWSESTPNDAEFYSLHALMPIHPCKH